MSAANQHRAYKHGSSDSKQSVNKARGRVVFENNGKALGGCADGTKTRDVVYFACLSGRSYLSPGEWSTADAGSISVRQGIFLPESTFSADSLTVSVQPPCAIACINIGTYVKDPKDWQPYLCLNTPGYRRHC